MSQNIQAQIFQPKKIGKYFSTSELIELIPKIFEAELPKNIYYTSCYFKGKRQTFKSSHVQN
jgi:hypothetical protein